MRRQVYQTPKSYLSFLQLYKAMYKEKINELKVSNSKHRIGEGVGVAGIYCLSGTWILNYASNWPGWEKETRLSLGLQKLPIGCQRSRQPIALFSSEIHLNARDIARDANAI